MANNENLNSEDAPAISEEPIDEELNVDQGEQDTAEEQEAQRLQIAVTVDSRGACERHITVTVPRDDIERYYDKEFSELMPSAQVPGFRPGRAPRKLIESRFRKDVSDRVKSSLLMDSLEQVNEDEGLSAISEPDIDLEAVDLPDEGPMTFEFDLEVRPDFDVPKWRGLTIEKPVRDFSEADVDRALQNVLANRGRLVPHEGPAEVGDYITTNLTFRRGDRVLSNANEEVIRIRPVLSFRDGNIPGFDKLMAGVTAGETRQTETELSQGAPGAVGQDEKIVAEFEVLEVKKLELPELDDELLEELGGFELEADLRDAIKDQLERQLVYQQHQRAREQITAALTVAADWDLPPELLERQSHRELERAVLELRRSGFGDDEIRTHENEIRQNSHVSTARALKEHFILERIAEDEGVDVDEADYDEEIQLIADQGGESPRRVRAKMEKGGTMDVLRNQIVERKVIEQILAHAKFEEVPFEPEEADSEAIDQAAGGHESGIPDAKPDSSEATAGGRPQERPVRE